MKRHVPSKTMLEIRQKLADGINAAALLPTVEGLGLTLQDLEMIKADVTAHGAATIRFGGEIEIKA